MSISKLNIFVFLFFCQFCFGRHITLPPVKIIDLQELISGKSFGIPANTTLQINFTLKNNLGIEQAYVIEMGREQYIQLFDASQKKLLLLATAGIRAPIIERSIRKDYSAITTTLKPNESKRLALSISNFYTKTWYTSPVLKSALEYQLEWAKKQESIIRKYLIPGFFILLICVIIFTVIQYFILPEKHFIYYFFYLLFLLIRSAAADERLIFEELTPIINKIGYSSTDSQVFILASFIFYLLFLNAFTGLQIKKPKLYIFYKIEIVYLVLFIGYDLAFPTQKYTDANLHSIFRAMETFGVLIGLLNIIILLKVYDRFNKYVIIGAFSLFLFAVLGQEIVKRTIEENNDPYYYSNALTLVWAVAYVIELVFFTIALVSRQRQLLMSIDYEKKKIQPIENNQINQNLLPQEKIETNDKTDFEYFSLATNKGVLIFQQTEIIRLEASGNYTIFSIQNDRQTLGSYTLADFENKLNPTQFLRVHKSHLVNLKYIVKYTKGDGGTLTLQDGSEIPVSRSRKDELLKRLHTI